ncbi:MAG TPA: hypothetical protein EYN71_03730 [Flavobacteriales bacterium]|nr:hypothetical protein [Flavobacteriales bacterium]HIO67247.1 hypothetical protein [Flavobacteriales bacterium]
MQIKYVAILIASGFLISCGRESATETVEGATDDPSVTAPAPECAYTLGDNATNVYWTAYKHTGKIAVKGKMDSVVVTGTETASSPIDALTNANVTIYTASINSKDDIRDKKLREIYFGSMTNTKVISGNLLSWEGSGVEGTCTFNLAMNDTAQQVTGSYIVDDVTVQIRFTIEPGSWGVEDAIAKLGAACAEKHTGEDGETVFWPDVDILIEVALNKECPDPV